MMNADILLLRALKGAPLSVLLAIRYLGRAGTSDLDAATGYDHEAIARALRALASMGFIVNAGRYHGWQLTSTAVQLPLFTPSQIEEGDASRERGISAVERGFSALPLQGEEGVLTQLELSDSELNTSSPSVTERGISALPAELAADADRLTELLVARLTCRRRRASEAVRAALLRGEAPAYVEMQLITWANWLAVEANRRGLRAPGMFVAAKLADAEPAPTDASISWADMTRYETLRRILTGDVVSPADPEAALPVALPELPACEACEVWAKARNQLRLQLPRSTFEAWVRDTTCLAHSADAFIIAVASANAKDWLSLRLRPLLQRTLADIVGRAVDLTFVAPGEGWQSAPESTVHVKVKEQS